MLKCQAQDRGDYYLDLAAEDYYLKGGEPPGKWHGKGAKSLSLGCEVKAKELKNLLRGYSVDGQKLVQNAGKENRQSGWDLTFSAPKSVSVAWSQSDSKQRKAFQDAHSKAVKRALEFIENEAILTRRGKGGEQKERAKVAIATFEHGTSRAHDPALHTHALVLNLALREDRTTGTIESRGIYQHKMAAGAIYRAELARLIETDERLGLIAEKKRSWFELKGVDKGLIDEFSKRRK